VLDDDDDDVVVAVDVELVAETVIRNSGFPAWASRKDVDWQRLKSVC
jgi:hypothetical protein